MNGKPKSWAALCKSVQATDLDRMPSQRMNGKRADKLILDCLALHANELGKGAHPGNAALMKASGLKWRQVHEHLALQIKVGIIVRTHVGDGAWNASVYDIIYSNPIFPDHSENGRECFLASCLNHSPNHAVKAEENSKPCGYEGEKVPNHAVSAGNHAVTESNHAVTMPHDILIPSEEQPQPNPSSKPPAPDGGGMAGGVLENQTLEWLRDGWKKNLIPWVDKNVKQTMGEISRKDKQALQDIVLSIDKTYGEQHFGYFGLEHALLTFCERSMDGVKKPWALFLSLFDDNYRAQAERKIADKIDQCAVKEVLELKELVSGLDPEFLGYLPEDMRKVLADKNYKFRNLITANARLLAILTAYQVWTNPAKMVAVDWEIIVTSLSDDARYGIPWDPTFRGILEERLQAWCEANPPKEDEL